MDDEVDFGLDSPGGGDYGELDLESAEQELYGGEQADPAAFENDGGQGAGEGDAPAGQQAEEQAAETGVKRAGTEDEGSGEKRQRTSVSSGRTQQDLSRVVCPYFNKGRCVRGDDCRFIHNLVPGGPDVRERHVRPPGKAPLLGAAPPGLLPRLPGPGPGPMRPPLMPMGPRGPPPMGGMPDMEGPLGPGPMRPPPMPVGPRGPPPMERPPGPPRPPPFARGGPDAGPGPGRPGMPPPRPPPRGMGPWDDEPPLGPPPRGPPMPPPDEFYDYEYDDWPRDPRGPPPPPPGPMRGRGPPPPDFHGGDDYDHYRNAEERRRYMELEVALAKAEMRERVLMESLEQQRRMEYMYAQQLAAEQAKREESMTWERGMSEAKQMLLEAKQRRMELQRKQEESRKLQEELAKKAALEEERRGHSMRRSRAAMDDYDDYAAPPTRRSVRTEDDAAGSGQRRRAAYSSYEDEYYSRGYGSNSAKDGAGARWEKEWDREKVADWDEDAGNYGHRWREDRTKQRKEVDGYFAGRLGGDRARRDDRGYGAQRGTSERGRGRNGPGPGGKPGRESGYARERW